MAATNKEAMIAPLMEQDLQQQNKFWQKITKELVADMQRHIARGLEVLAWEGLGLREATGTGKESRQGAEERQSTKEKAHKDTASTASEAAVPATSRALAGGAKEWVSPVKKLSPAKPALKHREHQALRYEH
ncbi:hypothetical protein C0993_001077 [Termitomyces sp. T159_Od127]|nr:hypothetical protein C0993_001077 [Termitomyces sp. T159_Od127]